MSGRLALISNLIWVLVLGGCDLSSRVDDNYHPGAPGGSEVQFTPASVTPSRGPTSGGTLLTITGTNFPRNWRRVMIGEIACVNPRTVDETTVTCVTGAHDAGTVDIRMERTETESQTMTKAFTFAASASANPVTVSSVVPSNGAAAGGTPVTVFGAGFTSRASVSFGGSDCGSVSLVNSRKLTCITSRHGAGAVNVSVTNPDSGVGRLMNGYTYVSGADPDAPTVISVSPSSGTSAGGTNVTITGTGFLSGAGSTASFGGSACRNLQRTSATTATCTTTAHLPGAVSVTFMNPDGRSGSAAAAFTYNGSTPITPNPTVTSITPNHGSTSGGTQVTIAGTGFESDVVVSIGGADCTNVSAGATSLTCTLPAHAAGFADVVVTTNDGRAGTLDDGYLYESGSPLPTIISVSPESDTASGGATIVLTGTNFVTGAGVTFGGVAATDVTVVSATSLTCVAPAHPAGSVDIVLTNPDSQTATLAGEFSYTAALPGAVVVTAVSPAWRRVSGSTQGTTMTLTGAGFVDGATITVGGVACPSIQFVSATQLRCNPPNGLSVGAKTITVTNLDTGSASLTDGIFYYPAVTVTGVSPSSGPASGGTRITITGTGFLPPSFSASVGGRSCSSVSTNSTGTELTCTTTLNSAGLKGVMVSSSDLVDVTLADAFTYVAAPTVTGVAPSAGAIAGGTTITVTGTGFTSDTTIAVGGQSCTNKVFSSATSMTCRTPAAAGPGAVTVRVTNADGQMGDLSGGFTYREAPDLISVGPTGGTPLGGTAVMLTGAHFSETVTVTFDGTPATDVVRLTDRQITCVSPPHEAGQVSVRVTNSDGQFDSTVYTYGAVPTISSFSPTEVGVAGTGTLTITGTNFEANAAVAIGTTNCPVVGNSATQITCTIPAKLAAEYPVRVTNPTSISAQATFLKYYATPTVTAVSPSAGSTSGDTLITLTGTNFTANTSIQVDGVPCGSISYVSATSMTCRTPARTAGTVAVSVHASATLTSIGSTLAAAFTYVTPLALASVSPASGPTTGNTLITLKGEGFEAGHTVLLGTSESCLSETVVNSGTITCLVPPRAAGAINVGVVPIGGGGPRLTNAYTYSAAALRVTSVSPSAGALAGSTPVTVTGVGFNGGVSSISFGGSACGQMSIASDTELTCTTSSHAAGVVDVQLITFTTNTVLRSGYTYQAGPDITAISPSSGPTTGGTTVTLTGSAFRSGAAVTFDGVSATNIAVVNETTITCQTPARVSAGAVEVKVTNSDSQTDAFSSFTYGAPPTITGISPTSAPTIGTNTLTVTGSGFSEGVRVSIDGTDCPVVTSATQQITCTVPAKGVGTYVVTVTNADLLTAQYNGLIYYVTPTISGVSPSFGPTSGDTLITLTGGNYLASTLVRVGNSPCNSVTLVNGTTLTCLTPARAAGTVDITVRAAADSPTASVISPGFTYHAPPNPVSWSPRFSAMAGGGTLTITGTDFVQNATVDLNGTACGQPQVSSGGTILTCTLPELLTAGEKTLRVVNPVGLAGTGGLPFIYYAAPTVTSVSPSAGPLAGGTTITLTGTNFTPDSHIKVDGTDCPNIVYVGPTSMTCRTPPHTAGAVDVVVYASSLATNIFGTRPSGFTYQAAPDITGISPASGPAAGGTNLSISGTGFLPSVAVTVGGGACAALTYLSSSSLICTTPLGVAGPANIVATNGDGQSDTHTSPFTYNPNATITGFSPTSGPVAGAISFTVYGASFLTGATVAVGGRACTSPTISVLNDSITCTLPAAASSAGGTVAVQVTNGDGGTVMASSQFTYVPAPRVTAYSTVDVDPDGGTPVTITGTGFQSGATVTFGNGPTRAFATSVVVVSATSITCVAPAYAADGAVYITVANPDGQSGGLFGIAYHADPTITGISPASGTTAGGTSVAITGTGLQNGINATLTVGGVACTSSTLGTTSATCVTPARVSAGAVSLTYTMTSGRTASATFTYTAAGPTITNLSPDSGPTNGSQLITVTGTGFTAGAAIAVDNVPVTVTFVNSTTLRFYTPPHRAGPAPVELRQSTSSVTSSVTYTAAAADDSWGATSEDDPETGVPLVRWDHASVFTNKQLFVWGGYTAYPPVFPTSTGALYDPVTDSWDAVAPITLPGVTWARGDSSAIWTGKEVIIWGGTTPAGIYHNTGAKYDPAAGTWEATSTSNAPEARIFHGAVWTGKEMIVWGGKPEAAYVNTGGRYDPVLDTWTATSVGANVPLARQHPVVAWTGKHMAVWGGDTGTLLGTRAGALYDPKFDTWTTITNTNAPSARLMHSMIWTGSDLIVWGGYSHPNRLNDGAKYDPRTGGWTAISTTGAPTARAGYNMSAWDGRHMVVWGGSGSSGPLSTGGKYDPVEDIWETAMTTTGAPVGRTIPNIAWTGSQILVWGDQTNTGGRYTPATNYDSNSWRTMSTTNAPSSVVRSGSVWTGREFITWGGSVGTSSAGGLRYDPVADTWAALATSGEPSERYGHTMAWTGREMVVWGGHAGSNSLNTGGLYDPATNTWSTMSTTNAPEPRRDVESVWTGRYFIPWGGYRSTTSPAYSGWVNSGGMYDPLTDTWGKPDGLGGFAAMPTTNAPIGRWKHTMVWTGQYVIIYGGGNSSLSSGGRFDPEANSWDTLMNSATGIAPWGVEDHTAVWTGTEMVIFGGRTSIPAHVNYGMAYNPETNVWRATHDSYAMDAPQGRSRHCAVWTGKEMLLWGGYAGASGGVLAVGKRMNVTAGTFTDMQTVNAPSARANMECAWTGREFIVWGGEDAFGTFQVSGARYVP